MSRVPPPRLRAAGAYRASRAPRDVTNLDAPDREVTHLAESAWVTPTQDRLDPSVAGKLVARGGVVRAGGYMVGLLAGLASVPLVIRHLGVVDSGRYVAVLAIVAVVGGLVDAGLTGVGVREYSVRAGASRDAMLRNLLGLRLCVTVVAGVLTVGLMTAAGYSSTLLAGAALACLGILLESASSTYTVWLSATLRLGWLTTAQVLRQLASVALTVALVVIGAPLLPFFAVVAAAPLVQLLVVAAVGRRAVPHLPSLSTRGWWALLRLTLPYAFATTIAILCFRISMILMTLLESAVQAGYFAAAFRIVEIVAGGVMLIVASAFPVLAHAAEHDRKHFVAVLEMLIACGLFVGAGVALIACFGAPLAISVVAGPDFEPSVAVLQILGAVFAMSFVGAAMTYALLALRAYRKLMIVNGVALVVALAATLALIPPLGARGAAIGTLAAEVALTAACLVALARELPELRPVPRVAPHVLSAVVVAVVLTVLASPSSFISVLLATVLYLGVLTAWSAVSSDVRGAVVRPVSLVLAAGGRPRRRRAGRPGRTVTSWLTSRRETL